MSDKPDSRPRCTAKAKQSGRQCKQPAIAPTTKCRFHGGLTPRGVASPHFKHGKHSKYLPQGLRSDYDKAVRDPQLLSLRSQVALLEARELELTRKLGELQAPQWTKAAQALVEYEKSLTSNDQNAIAKGLTTLRTTICKGADGSVTYQQTWEELRDLIQDRTKVAQAENKRLADIGGFVTVEDMMGVLLGLLAAVRDHVADKSARQAIQMRFDQLIDTRSQQTEQIVINANESNQSLEAGPGTNAKPAA